MSLRKAINNKCKECIFDEYAKGTWRQQIEACTSKNCALFPVRPKRTVTITGLRIVDSSPRIGPISLDFGQLQACPIDAA